MLGLIGTDQIRDIVVLFHFIHQSAGLPRLQVGERVNAGCRVGDASAIYKRFVAISQ